MENILLHIQLMKEYYIFGRYVLFYGFFSNIFVFYLFRHQANTFFSSSNTIHLVSRHAAQRLDRSIPSPMKKVDLNWIDRTTVRMYWHVDKSEKKFTV